MAKKKFHKNKISEISEKLLTKIVKMKNDKAKVIAFSGDLGAGKTTLTQELARQLGIKDKIISPTFVIMKIYEINKKFHSSFKKLIHIDAYRLDSHLELSKIGWSELVDDKDNLIIIEWPEKVAEQIPDSAFRITLSHIDNENRYITF